MDTWSVVVYLIAVWLDFSFLTRNLSTYMYNKESHAKIMCTVCFLIHRCCTTSLFTSDIFYAVLLSNKNFYSANVITGYSLSFHHKYRKLQMHLLYEQEAIPSFPPEGCAPTNNMLNKDFQVKFSIGRWVFSLSVGFHFSVTKGTINFVTSD